MAFSEVVRNPVYMQVAEQIREAILSGHLAAGETLPTERELASQFGVSRATIREALRALQAQGLVSGGGRTTPYRTIVTTDGVGTQLRESLTQLVRLRGVPLEDLVDLRWTLEAAALARAAERPNPDRLAEARAALEEMRDPAVTIEAFEEADVLFHVALVAASGNEAMHLIMLAVRDSIARHLLHALRQLPDSRATLRRLSKQHAAMFAAVEAGDGERAGDLVKDHIMGFYRRVTGAETNAKRTRRR